MQTISEILQNEQLLQMLGLVFGVVFVGAILAGMTNKVVVYFDFNDFFVSLMTVGIWVIAFIALSILEKEGQTAQLNTMQVGTIGVSALISVVCGITSVKSAIDYNRSMVIGLIIGVVKILTAIVGVVMILGQFQKLFEDDSSSKDVIVAMFLLGLFTWIGNRLINGEEVYEEKGWELPDQ
jgi:amino acid permease